MKFLTDSALDDSNLDIDITPLIDVVFLLLIFFMVSTTFVNARALPIDLPQTLQGEQVSEQRDLVLSINKQGEMFLGEKKVNLEQLKSSLQTENSETATANLVIRADEHVQHGTVVKVMDLAKTQGIKKIAIATAAKHAS